MDKQFAKFRERVVDEACKAYQTHGGIRSLHEGYGVLIEEVAEFFDEVRKKTPDKMRLVEELAQIAATCERIANDNCGVP